MLHRDTEMSLSPDEARAAIREAGAPLFHAGSDFGGFDETLLTERFDRPVMVTHWPGDIKAFYMQPDAADPSKALAVDVLAPDRYRETFPDQLRDRLPVLVRLRDFWQHLPPGDNC